MKRVLVKAISCLIIGCAASVVVAWGAALYSPVAIVGTGVGFGAKSVMAALELAGSLPSWMRQAIEESAQDRADVSCERRSFAGPCVEIQALDVTIKPPLAFVLGPAWTRFEIRAGWPATAFSGSVWETGEGFDSSTLDFEAAVPADAWDSLAGQRSTSSGQARGLLADHRAPLPSVMLGSSHARPIPTRLNAFGLALNTTVMAMTLFGIVSAPGWLRGSIRARRGRCVACGYVLAGLAACPECGKMKTAGRTGDAGRS